MGINLTKQIGLVKHINKRTFSSILIVLAVAIGLSASSAAFGQNGAPAAIKPNVSSTAFGLNAPSSFFGLNASPITFAQNPGEPLPLEGRIIVLDAGHGLGADNFFEGYSEQATMLSLALRIKPLLQELGAEVYLTRPTEQYVSLPVRAALINRLALLELRETLVSEHAALNSGFGAGRLSARINDIDRLLRIIQNIIDDYETYAPILMNFPFDHTFERRIHPALERVFRLQNDPRLYERFLVISLHSNATGRPINTSINGADAFVMSNTRHTSVNYFNEYSNIERSRYFADLILDGIDSLGIQRRQIREAAFFILREHNLPAVLVENGFHTNAEDRAKLMCDEFLDQLARVYVEAVLGYFEFVAGNP